MTDRELLQQALDSLEWAERRYSHANLDLFNKPIAAIRTRLAQPDGVEGEVRVQIRMNNKWFRDSQLEAAIATGWVAPTPPKKEWVGLTDEEILEEYRQSYGDDGDLTDVYFARVIEFRLKEKNNAT